MWAKPQVDCEHILFQYITMWQGATPLISFSNDKFCRSSPVHAWELALYTTVIATNPSSRSRELEDGAPLLEETTSLWTSARRAAALQPPVRQGWRSQSVQRTEAWPCILLCIWAQVAQTQREKDSTFNHKANFFFELHKLIVSKWIKN